MGRPAPRRRARPADPRDPRTAATRSSRASSSAARAALADLTPDEREAVEALARGVAAKLLHDPIVELKERSEPGTEPRRTPGSWPSSSASTSTTSRE